MAQEIFLKSHFCTGWAKKTNFLEVHDPALAQLLAQPTIGPFIVFHCKRRSQAFSWCLQNWIWSDLKGHFNWWRFFLCENHDFLVNERSMLICTRFTAMTSPFSLKYRFSHILRVQNAFVIEIRDKIDCLVVILVQPLFPKMYSVSSNSLYYCQIQEHWYQNNSHHKLYQLSYTFIEIYG